MKNKTRKKKEVYIRCRACGDEVYGNTHKKMIPCSCGTIEIDGCEDYVRIIGSREDYKIVHRND